MYTIHFIWLGQNRIPREIINTWKSDTCVLSVWRDYPDEKYGDIDIKTLGDFPNKELFDTSDKYNQKSDILRLAILYRYGGVYMDSDIVKISNKCVVDVLKSYTSQKNTGVYITYEKRGCISNSVIYADGAENSVIKYLMDGLAGCDLFDKHGKYISVCESTGPKYITSKLVELGYNDILPYHIVNFGIDYAKSFACPDFVITENMKNKRRNKDLVYDPDFDCIVGCQMWMGGKSSRYNAITPDFLDTVKKNYDTYIQCVKHHYNTSLTKSK
jgi:hypothetical protein